MSHLNESTYLHLMNCVWSLLRIIRRLIASPGPLTHEEDVAIRKAEEVHQVATSEAKLAGILPHAVTGDQS